MRIAASPRRVCLCCLLVVIKIARRLSFSRNGIIDMNIAQTAVHAHAAPSAVHRAAAIVANVVYRAVAPPGCRRAGIAKWGVADVGTLALA